MELEIKGVHFTVHDDTREFITTKLEKLEFAAEYIEHLQFTLTRETPDFVAEVKLHLNWGHSSVIKVHSYDLHEGINTLIDKLDHKIRKERDKVTDHK
ncbi:MAG: ribosome-associated translation inhibitor RaiA [Spirochaetaceae bacterium]|nr:ribosome-associated translation inhibitor RaiA [Spirochaetaceae bacterium]